MELCNPDSSQILTHFLSQDIEFDDIKSGIPRDTQFISIGSKYMSDHSIVAKTESNLCVLVDCLGISGQGIEGFSPCYVTVTGVRNWVNQCNYRK